jgi:hypothetical protein
VPIARYFIFVGGALAALLFIPGSRLPTPPAMFADQSVGLDGAVIRIKSAHKWPEKVILDTSQLTITRPVIVDPPAIQSATPPLSDKAPDQSNLKAMALLKPEAQPAAINHSTLQIKRGVARAARSRRVARGPVTQRRTGMSGGCCQFGWVDSGQTNSNVMPPGALRRHGPWIDWGSIGEN